MTKQLVLSVMYILHDCFCLIKSLSNVIVSHLVYEAYSKYFPKCCHLKYSILKYSSSCFSSALLSVHASQPYKAIGSMSDLNNLILVSFLMFLFFTFKAVAVLILMSVEQSQFAVRVVPRYLKLYTCCSSFRLSNST